MTNPIGKPGAFTQILAGLFLGAIIGSVVYQLLTQPAEHVEVRPPTMPIRGTVLPDAHLPAMIGVEGAVCAIGSTPDIEKAIVAGLTTTAEQDIFAKLIYDNPGEVIPLASGVRLTAVESVDGLYGVVVGTGPYAGRTGFVAVVRFVPE